MSLTSHLDYRSSPVRQFFEERLPNVADVQRRWRTAGPRTIEPKVRTDLGTVGTAFDYRLRYYFAVSDPEDLVAPAGARRLVFQWNRALRLRDPKQVPGPEDSAQLWQDFSADLMRLAGHVRPVGRRLARAAERELCRYCYVLGLFEQLFRAPVPGSPLLVEQLPSSTSDLLRLAPAHALDDLVALSRAFYESQGHLLERPVVLNPTFAGSIAVGGADADLIVDGCLIDVKVTVRNCRREHAYQLVGYPLLNWDNAHSIESVGVYLARVPVLLEWPLDQMLSEMAGSPVSLPELQADLQLRLQEDES